MKRSQTFNQRLVVALLVIATLLSVPHSTFAQTHNTGESAIETTTLQQRTGLVAVTGTDGARLCETPAGTVTQRLGLGQTVTVIGRTTARDWLFLYLTDETTGWVAADELVVFGVDRLPVVEMVGGGAVDSGAVDSGAVDSGAVDSGAVDSEAVDSETVSNGTAPVLTAQITVRDSRLNIRSGPATSYPVVGKAEPAQTLTLLGRDAAGEWTQIQITTGDPVAEAQTDAAFGWVASRYLATTGDLMALPVVETVSSAPAYQESTPQPMTPASASVPVVEQSASAATTLASATGGSATGLTGTLVFQSGPGGMIYAYRLATGELWPLANGFDPAISPDGRSVAFVREGGETGIYLINLDGSNARLIFSGRTRLSSPKWSPDGSWILFTRSDEYTECVELGRGGCRDISALPPGFPADDLTLSKDYEYHLAAVDTNGDQYHDIAALESARVADWNAAGIVYQSSAGLQITADHEDAENRLLLFIPLQPPHEDPDWQPNGGRVAFVQHHGSHYEIFTINPDGSGMTPLTRPVTTLVEEMPNNLAPAWSPDGQHIVFLSNRDAGNEAGAWRIWVMDADGGNQRPLPIDITINYTYGNEQAVSWGP